MFGNPLLMQRRPLVEPSSSSVKLLIAPPVGATSVLDYSASAHVLTPIGEMVLSNAVADPWGGARKVIAMDGAAGAGYSLSDHDDFTLPDVFTLETWVYFTSASNHALLLKWHATNDALREHLLLATETNVIWYYRSYSNAAPMLSAAAPAVGSWVLITLVRNGSSWTMYYGDTPVSTCTFSGSSSNTAQEIQIGRFPVSVYSLKGYLGAMRLTNGVAREPSQFMLSSAPSTS